jgi:glycosyltransferase involved in cell wall biosynthesis
MRIVIDMQGAQSIGSWNRGIGRYTMSLALAIVRNRGQHEVFLALNGAFPASIERIRANFDTLLPQENIRVWNAHPPMAYIEPRNEWRRQSGELIREAFLASLKPDFILISSLFEGLGDDAVTSLKQFSDECLIAVILYDLIPFIHRQPYLDNPAVEKWYLEKVEHFRHADLWLAISDSSCLEGVEYLDLPSGRCVSISTDADDHFRQIVVPAEAERRLRKKFGLTRNFVMYTGGIDHRKNIEGLIRAYAKLSPQLRATHQLVIVCSVQEDSRRRLLALATVEGMNENDVVLTGFVPEEDLIALYNLCAVFVFPSLHEGFGLPALEAMRCGAPVIAANTSSLPEVIGLANALFDPHSDEAIMRMIERVLTDKMFRAQLVAHGEKQSNKFSWDESARRAIDAMERVVIEQKPQYTPHALPRNRPKLAYVSPLPPERSGIADYSVDLLPALAQYYEIEVVVAQNSITDPWITAHCPIRTVQWFVENRDLYDRVLYHFGNSAFHQHMFGLLETIPGVVVLHDFYLAHVLHNMEISGYAPGCFTKHLHYSHGYVGLLDRAQANDIEDVIWKYPCSRSVIENSMGTIVHSEHSIRLAQRWYGDDVQACSVIPLLRVPAKTNEALAARKALGFSDNDFLVCSFGMLGPNKLNHRLLKAWFDSTLAIPDSCHLVFVGENHGGDYGNELISLIKRHPNGISVHITGWVDQEIYRKYLAAANLGVQLRTLSRGETSAAVLDCMNYGMATIVNANGSMADLGDDVVWKLPDEFEDQALIDALETLRRDHDRRNQIGNQARSVILENHDPARCAEQYQVAIESLYTKSRPLLKSLLGAIATISTEPGPDHELMSLANSIVTTFPPVGAGRTLMVDISELVQCDAKTGIQRVVRSILHHWLIEPPVGWRVEPVYATASEPYRYAKKFTIDFLGIPSVEFNDEPVDFVSSDVFFALDLCPQVQIAKADFYQHLRQQGVTVKFMVYDLLCILQPQHFLPGVAEGLSNWLQIVAECDGAICISRAVADDLRDWMGDRTWQRLRPFQLISTPLGANVTDSAPSRGLPADAADVLAILKQQASFLMVGTLEPRKGHAQVLDAFEHLWSTGEEANLVIVGKQGWLVESLINRLRSHHELGKHLFWLEGISDEFLEKVYQTSTCLIAASYGEGFGLPLIEAAQHKLPIIARNIPVFHEVAGGHAFYFDGSSAQELSGAINVWLEMYKTGKHPKSDAMPWLTWKESARQLLNALNIPPVKKKLN